VKSGKWKVEKVYCLEFRVKIKKVYGLCLEFGFFGKLKVEESGKI